MNIWYLAHLTLIQGTLISIPLVLSTQIGLRAGVFSLAPVGFYGIGGYAGGILMLHGWPVALATVVPIVGTGLLALLISGPLVRLRGLYLGMVTFAFDLVLTVVVTNGGSLTGGAAGLFAVPLGATTIEIVIIVVVILVFARQLERGRIGRVIRSMRYSEELSRSVGIDVRRNKQIIFTISGVLGATSGVLEVLMFSTINPTTAAFSLVITTLTMAVIGGIGSWIGAIVGSVVITWLPTVLAFIGEYRNMVYGALLALVVMFAPNGIVGLVQNGWRNLGAARGNRDSGDGQPPVGAVGDSGSRSGKVAAVRAADAGGTSGVPQMQGKRQ